MSELLSPFEGDTPNSAKEYEVTQADLPVRCPRPSDAVWSSHPRVTIDLDADGVGACSYCGAIYRLKA